MQNQTSGTEDVPAAECLPEELELKRQKAWTLWRVERIKQKDASVRPGGMWVAPKEGWPPADGAPLKEFA